MKHIHYSTLFIILALTANIGYTESKTIIQINDTKIDQNYFTKFKAMRKKQSPAMPAKGIDERLKSELVNRELLYQAAINEKLDENKNTQFNLLLARQEVLIKAVMQKALQKNPVTEDHIKKEYEINVAKNKGKEYKARHILVADEAKAKELIEKLNSGDNFEKLATDNSTGPSNKKGGDLGWFPGEQMVPKFSAAIAKMKKGTYSKEPVNTRFGWHIIKLENIRTATPPEYKQVKDRLKVHLQNKVLSEYVDVLRKKSKIKIQ